MWVKLKSKNVPNDYSVMGLERKDFEASNDLYGSFCSVQVRLQSDDMDIQKAMNGADWATAYFAVGDTFTCGSWIPADTLEDLANAAVNEATEDMRDRQGRTEFWTTLLGTVGGAIGGGYLGAGIQDGTVFGKMTGLKKDSSETSMAVKYIDAIKNSMNSSNPDVATVTNWMVSLKTEAKKLKVSDSDITPADNAVAVWASAQKTLNSASKPTEEQKSAVVTAKTNAVSALDVLKTACENADGTTESKNQWLAPTLGAVLTGAAGGFLVNKATRDIQASNLSSAEKAAYEEWMNNVGKHIKCYIGPDEAGEYGDILSVTME